MPVANCTKCRKIFQRSISPLCPQCYHTAQSQVSNVYRFIQENPELTLDDVSAHCHVPLKELETMLFEGKLGTAANKVIYHCQRCSRPMNALMRRGRFCVICADRIETEAGLNIEKEKPEEKREKTAPRPIKRGTSEERPHQPVEAAGEEDFNGDEDLSSSWEMNKPASPTTTEDSYGFKRVSEG